MQVLKAPFVMLVYSIGLCHGHHGDLPTDLHVICHLLMLSACGFIW